MRNETEDQYLKIAHQLIERYTQESGNNWQDAPIVFCQWIHALSKDWKADAWRLRKCALIFFMSHYGPADAKKFLTAAEKTQTPTIVSPKKQSPCPTRKISVVELTALIRFLQKEGHGKHDLFAAQWFLVGLMIDIKPLEWLGSSINGRSVLIKNKGFDSHSGFSPYKQIYLKNDQLSYLGSIYTFVEELSRLSLTSDQFKKLFIYCRTRLYIANEKLWPNRREKIGFNTKRSRFSVQSKTELAHLSSY